MNVVPGETAPRGSLAGPLYGIYMVALAVCLVGNLALRVAEPGGWLPGWARVAVAVGTALPLGVAAGLFWRMLRRDLDEMLQRVVLEGLSLALIVYVPLAALYLNLRTAGVWTPRLDPPDLLMTPALLVALGVAIAWRRYR